MRLKTQILSLSLNKSYTGIVANFHFELKCSNIDYVRIPINHKRARVRQALLLSLIWVLASTRALLTKEEKKKKKKKKKTRVHLINEFSSNFHKSSFLPHQKILFLSKVMLVFLPAPIWVLASTRALLEKKKKKKKKKHA